MTRPYQAELDVTIAAAILAARAIEVRCGGQPVVQYKSPIEPVTEADIAADRVLRRELMGAFPRYGWLSEESLDDSTRMEKRRVWVVDPLDGTREFVAGRPEFMVSVALCEDGQPIVGVLAHPLTHQIWAATRGGGATLDGEPISVSSVAALSDAEVVVSRSETGRGLLKCYDDTLNMRPAGGMANKLALISDGRSEATFTTDRRCEWDLAAGLLIVEEAGGTVTRLDGGGFTFNNAFPKFYGVAASNGLVHADLLRVVNAQNDAASG